MKWIVNQDRDCAYKYEGIDYFNIEYKYLEEICICFNLYYRENFLGTFDSVDECVEEIYNIILSLSPIYFVNGYSFYE